MYAQEPKALSLNDKKKQISEIQIKKVEIKLSLAGKKLIIPLFECLWPRITLISNGKEKSLSFTHWQKLINHRYDRQDRKGYSSLNMALRISKLHTIEDLISMTTGIRGSPMEYPIMCMAKEIERKVNTILNRAVRNKSFLHRYKVHMRKIERSEGLNQLKELLITLRLEKRDVIQAWNEVAIKKIHDC